MCVLVCMKWRLSLRVDPASVRKSRSYCMGGPHEFPREAAGGGARSWATHPERARSSRTACLLACGAHRVAR
eukprot:865285-Pyramimonas_sp.AAC.1